jgi:hypothetical protein
MAIMATAMALTTEELSAAVLTAALAAVELIEAEEMVALAWPELVEAEAMPTKAMLMQLGAMEAELPS